MKFILIPLALLYLCVVSSYEIGNKFENAVKLLFYIATINLVENSLPEDGVCIHVW